MRIVAAIALVAALGATSSGSSVTLHGTNMSFKEALSTCAGTLGSVAFTLGHIRVQTADGVDTDSNASAPGVESITFNGPKGQSAIVSVNAQTRSVSAKHLEVKANNSVACILPD